MNKVGNMGRKVIGNSIQDSGTNLAASLVVELKMPPSPKIK